MKARYIVPQRAVNPKFSNKDKREAKRQGEAYDVDPYIEIPVGFVEEGEHCWSHCCPGFRNSPPVCEPVDDECRERVRRWMEVERPKHLEQIRIAAKPENLRKMKPKDREHVKDLASVYGLDPEGEPVTTINETGDNTDGNISEQTDKETTDGSQD